MQFPSSDSAFSSGSVIRTLTLNVLGASRFTVSGPLPGAFSEGGAARFGAAGVTDDGFEIEKFPVGSSSIPGVLSEGGAAGFGAAGVIDDDFETENKFILGLGSRLGVFSGR